MPMFEIQNLSLKFKKGIQLSIKKIFAKVTSTEILLLMHIKKQLFILDSLTLREQLDKSVV